MTQLKKILFRFQINSCNMSYACSLKGDYSGQSVIKGELGSMIRSYFQLRLVPFYLLMYKHKGMHSAEVVTFVSSLGKENILSRQSHSFDSSQVGWRPLLNVILNEAMEMASIGRALGNLQATSWLKKIALTLGIKVQPFNKTFLFYFLPERVPVYS